MYSEEYL
jgi:hypothetical protein